MKKIISKTVFFSIVLTFVQIMASCTLDMTDWIESEEDRGYGETVKEENDFYSVEYEYKENTRSLTDKIREYLVNVEADSILYFMDNLPSEWIPQAGGQVVCNCCVDFPMGLVSKVLSVEKSGGMIKVVTTPCELEDAYEDFQLDMDMDVISSENPEMMQTETFSTSATRSGETAKTVTRTYDWTMFNYTSKGEKVRCLDGKVTRADDEEDYFNKDMDSDSTKTVEVPIFSFDENSAPLKQIVEKNKKYVDKASISLSYVTKTRVIKKIRVKSEYEYTKQIETTGYKISVLAGKGKVLVKQPKSDKLLSAEIQDAFTQYLIESGQAFVTDPLPASQNNPPEEQFLKEIPLGSLPVGLVIRVKPVFDFSVSLVGQGDITFWTAKTQTEVTLSHGEKTESKPKQLATPSNEYSASIAGKFNISGGVEGFIGMGKVIGPDMLHSRAYALGGYLKATLDFEAKLQFGFTYDDCLNGSVNSGFSLTANIEFGLKGLGGRWGDYTFVNSGKIPVWTGFDVSFFPRVKVNPQIDLILHDGASEKYKQFKVKYSFEHLGIFARALNTYYKPGLRIYKGDNTDDSAGDFVDVEPDKIPSWVTSGKEYTFTYKVEDLEQDFTVVPFLKCTLANMFTTLFYDNKRYIDKECRPMIKLFTQSIPKSSFKQVVYQVFGDHPVQDMGVLTGLFNNAMEALGFYQYEFTLPFYMYNASAIKDYWSDFGIEYNLKIGSTYKSKSKSLIKKITRSGYYSPNVSFITKTKGENRKVTATAYLYYVLKDDPDKKKRYFYGPDAWIFTHDKYIDHSQGNFPGEMKVHDNTELVYPFSRDEWDWEKEFLKHSVKDINIDVTI